MSTSLCQSPDETYAVASGPAIALASTFTAQPIEATLRTWLDRLNWPLPIAWAPIAQIFQTLLDPNSTFGVNRGGINVLVIRWEDFGGTDVHALAQQLQENIREAAASGIPLLVVTAQPSPGWLASLANPHDEAQAEQQFSAALAAMPGVRFASWREQQTLYPVPEYYDELGDRLGMVPYVEAYFAALGTLVARHVDVLKRRPYKVIALDLDNTLWRGVVGEEGPAGVGIDGGFRALQEFLSALQRDGLLLVMCSKNNEPDALEVFQTQPDMPLRLDQFASWRINWEPKSANIQALAAELNLGLDSFLFIDDSALECAEVREACPDVTVLPLPKDERDIPAFLQHVWAFDHLPATAEDRQRTASYQRERARGELARQTGSLSDFLAKLELVVDLAAPREDQFARVAQLTQRTNQFNCTTIRRTEPELRALLTQSYECLSCDVRDRFGDYGLVGMMLFHPAGNALAVDTFLLSCRVLARGVEYRMVNRLGERAAELGLDHVNLLFRPTAKNAPARAFLEAIGLGYRQPGAVDGDLVFSLPTEYARHAVYTPPEGAAPSASTDEKLATAASVTAARRPDYASLALDSQDPRRLAQPASFTAEDDAAVSAPPRNDLEARLAKLWASALRRPAIGIHDNFFEVGGDSLLAVSVIAQTIREFANDTLTLSAMLQAPTVAEFAVLLQMGGSTEFRSLVPMRPSGSRPPFYCVHGAGGNVLSLRDLAMSLPADQPFYCLQARGLDGSEPFATIEQSAQHYVQEIRQFQPAGPYYLGGGCYGGIVAFEMARQLQQQGEEVALLAMIDTYNQAYGSLLPKGKLAYYNARFLGRRVWHHVRRFGSLRPSEWTGYLQGRLVSAGRRLRDTIAVLTKGAHLGNVHAALPDLPVGDLNADAFTGALQRVVQANLNAAQQYTPRPYAGSLLMYRASIRAIEPYEDRYLGWGQLTEGGVEDVEIPGDHAQITTDPWVRVLGEDLDRHLRTAQKAHRAAYATSAASR